MEKVKVTVSIPKEYLEKLETRAVELGVTRADLMRCVLADYLTGRKHVMEVRPQKVFPSLSLFYPSSHQLRYHFHIEPDTLDDTEWATAIAALEKIRKDEAGSYR